MVLSRNSKEFPESFWSKSKARGGAESNNPKNRHPNQFYAAVVFFYGLVILPVKFMQNRQNKQQHFYSTGKIAHRLSKSIAHWNIRMARSRNRKILSGLCAQWEGVSAVLMQWFNDSHHKNIVIFSKTRYM